MKDVIETPTMEGSAARMQQTLYINSQVDGLTLAELDVKVRAEVARLMTGVPANKYSWMYTSVGLDMTQLDSTPSRYLAMFQVITQVEADTV